LSTTWRTDLLDEAALLGTPGILIPAPCGLGISTASTSGGK